MKRQYLLSLAAASLLSACAGPAGTYKVYWDSITTAFSTPADAEISRAQVQASRYGLLMVKPGDAPRAVMALAYLEHGQYKWISADDAMLITEHGRVVKSLNLTDDLLFTAASEVDPLSLDINTLIKGASWQRQLDFAKDRQHDIIARSDFRFQGEESISVLQQNYTTYVVAEHVTFGTDEHSLTNMYWFNKANGKLLRSIQQPSPSWPVFELTFLSNAL